MSEPGAAEALDKLSKLPENKACANCGVVAATGHGAMVMSFAMFVCHTCKSSHQSYSHYCKSKSMSYWSHAEVEKLRAGGNARARATWMGRLPAGGRLKTGASLEATKQFVNKCYNEKRWCVRWIDRLTERPIDRREGVGDSSRVGRTYFYRRRSRSREKEASPHSHTHRS